jgi:hypothetical protein
MKFLIQLFILTMLFYYSLNLLERWMDPMERYQKPSGNSTKVFQQEMAWEQQKSIKERLAMFYWMGE